VKKKYKKILIIGLPGAGKTTLAKELAVLHDTVNVNADQVRKKAKDRDFSYDGRLGQISKIKNNKF
jgi:adenylylsulfate kinase